MGYYSFSNKLTKIGHILIVEGDIMIIEHNIFKLLTSLIFVNT